MSNAGGPSRCKSRNSGAYPSLTDLQDGDLKHGIDFRAVFATVARDCWGLQRDFGLRQPQRLEFLKA